MRVGQAVAWFACVLGCCTLHGQTAAANPPPVPDMFGQSMCKLRTGDEAVVIAIGAPRASTGAFECGEVFVIAAQSGRRVCTLRGVHERECFGSHVGAARSESGDQLLVVSQPEILTDDAIGMGTGVVSVYDAAEWRRVLTVQGQPKEVFGGSTAASPEGWRGGEILVGSPMASRDRRLGAGRVDIFSSEGGMRTGVFLPKIGDSRFGYALAVLGPTSGGDYLIGVGVKYAATGVGEESGLFRIYSRERQVSVAEVAGALPFGRFGHSVVALDGIDDDCIGKFLVSAPGPARSHASAQRGSTSVICARTGAILAVLRGSQVGDGFGRALAVGDADGDGVSDYIIGAPLANSGTGRGLGRVDVFSGATSELLYSHMGQSEGEHFGASLETCGDVDGDRCTDYFVGSPHQRSPGFVSVVSGKSGGVIRRISR